MRWRNVGFVFVAAIAAAFAWQLRPQAPIDAKSKVSRVVLITIDALRRDRLGCYGYSDRPTSPNLNAWAPHAVVFDEAFAPAPWTVPSLGAIFTNHHPFQIGAYTNLSGISPDFVTLPEIFQQHGFVTASFNTHALLITETSGFLRGFDTVFPTKADLADDDMHKMPFARTEPALMAWLDKHAKDRFFLWVHNMDTHQPLTEGNTYLDDPAWSKYDAEVRWVDEAFGRIMRKLQALGIWDDSLIIFTADHGEAFGEHGILGHQDCMYDEVLRIPLLIQYPDGEGGRRVSEPVESLDLFPTILELAGLPPESGVGESLVPLFDGRRDRRRNRYLFHSRFHYEKAYHEIAVRDRWWKLLVTARDLGTNGSDERRAPAWDLDASSTQFELYHPATDPEEANDLYEDHPEVVDRLRQVLADWQTSMRPPEEMSPELDEAGREALRALGYGGDE
jgi:arylsulfatase A-like enzyme